MSSKLQFVSVMVLAAFLAGCNSTKTASIDPGGNNGGSSNGDNNGGSSGGNGDGGSSGGSGDGGNNGGDPATYNLTGRFLTFSRANSGNPEVDDGNMKVTIAPGTTSPANVKVTGTPNSVPGGELPATSAGIYASDADNFLDLSQGGANYDLGAYVRKDNDNWYVGAVVGGNPTNPDQIEANGTYIGEMRAAVVPVGWTKDVQPYEATGDVRINLSVGVASATVDGAITNIRLPDLAGSDALTGQITLHEATVTGNAYEGELSSDLDGVSGDGIYDGAFYGPGAAETAGTFEMDGNMPTPAGNTGYTIIGGFGASK